MSVVLFRHTRGSRAPICGVALAMVLGALCAPPVARAFPPTVSARGFVDGFSQQSVQDGVADYTVSYRAHVEVRGAATCDSWSIGVDGPGGGTFARPAGAVQEVQLSATVSGGQTVAITVTGDCSTAGTTVSGTSETTYATAPPSPGTPANPFTEPPDVPTRVAASTLRDLRALSAASARLALLACPYSRSVARAQARRHARELLRALCVTSSWDTLAAATTGLRSSGPATVGLPTAAPPPIRQPSRRETCHGLRSRARCAGARRMVAAALAGERALAGVVDAFSRTAAMLSESDPAEDSTALLAAGAADYAERIGSALQAARRTRAALASRLRHQPRLGGRGLRRARAAFSSGKSLPAVVRRAFGEQGTRVAAAALRGSARRKALSLSAELRGGLATDGLNAGAVPVGWPELVRVVATLGGSDGAAALAGFADDLDLRDQTCDVTQRNRYAADALAGLAAYSGDLDWLVRRLAARVSPPVDTSPPDGCPVPVAPKPPTPGSAFGSFGTGPGQFDRPTDVAVGPGGVYVADQDNSRVERFTADGRFVSAWGGRPQGDGPLADGQFITPVGVALDQAGNVYVTDFLGERVQKFTADGRFLLKWGASGSGNGQFVRMAGIAVGPNGHVYVADPGNGRVQVFDQNGTFLSQFGSPGTGPGQFSTPRGLAIDGSGTVYLADRNTGRVEEFAADGTFIRQFGQRGTDPGTFNGVYDIAVDSAGNLWIADLYNYWIQHFTPTGGFLGLVDTFGAGQSFNPFAVATDSAGHVYVADIDGGTGDRVLIFDGLG